MILDRVMVGGELLRVHGKIQARGRALESSYVRLQTVCMHGVCVWMDAWCVRVDG